MRQKSLLPLVVGPRTAPTDILAMLREVSPAVDLINPGTHGGRVWWLLRYTPDGYARRDEGRKILSKRDPRYFPVLTHVLMAEGFSLLKQYTINIDGNGEAIRADLSMMLNRSERELDRDFQSSMECAEGVPRDRNRIAVFKDFMGGEGRSEHAIHFRGRVSSLSKASLAPSLVRAAASSVRRVLNAASFSKAVSSLRAS
jgi:hypothetical protein